MSNDDLFNDRLVEQLHACLGEALRKSRPNPFGSPVSVAEIYQDLVPYRNVRSRLGFDMNADYEHTLLRLLAGEGGLARLEPSEARGELRAELESPNPNVGLFRKFAACDVWISQPSEAAAARVANGATAPAEANSHSAASPPGSPAASVALAEAEAEMEMRDRDWTAEDEPELLLVEEVDEGDIVDQVLYEMPTQPKARKEPAVTTTSTEPSNGRTTAEATATGCLFCDADLPRGRTVKFCPHCGVDQSLVPCASCGEALEPDWRFCIGCGTNTGTPQS